MVGDMFNNALKARVDALCTELAGLVGAAASRRRRSRRAAPAPACSSPARAGGGWWPEGLGTPASVGAQNDMRYAFFPATRRLAIAAGGQVTVYDTGDHRLSGFAQQQSGDRSLSFTSQHGLVRVADLAVVAAGRRRPGGPAAGERPPRRTASGAARLPGRRRRRRRRPGRDAGRTTSSARSSGWPICMPAASSPTEEFEAKKAELSARL